MESKEILNTYALITGGGRGIGQALAIELASLGYNIALVALPNSGLRETKELLEAKYDISVAYLETDFCNQDAISEISNWISSQDFKIKVLVNNAGIGFAQPFNLLEEHFVKTLIDVNIRTTTLLTHSLLPNLISNNKAYILNMSSAAAFYSMPYKSIYAASKRYIMDFSLALREELKSENVNVTAVCPAGVITSSEIKDRISNSGLLVQKSALQPEQVAKEAIAAMLKNRPYIVPGKLARLMSQARYIFPTSFQRKIIGKSFRKKR